MVQLLLESGSNVRFLDGRRATALHRSVVNQGDATIANMLLEAGSPIDAVDIDGNTSLHIAAMEDARAVALSLLENGANSRIKNKDGLIPLQVAISDEMRELLESQT